MHTCSCMCVKARSSYQEDFLSCSVSCSLRLDLSVNLEVAFSARLASEPQGYAYLCPFALGLSMLITVSRFVCFFSQPESRDLNSGPHTCSASTAHCTTSLILCWGSNTSSHAASKYFTDRTSLQPLAANLQSFLGGHNGI